MQRPDTIFVQPVDGILVRHENPLLGHVDAAGEDVTGSRYYRRRLRDGDLVRGERPAAPRSRSTKKD